MELQDTTTKRCEFCGRAIPQGAALCSHEIPGKESLLGKARQPVGSATGERRIRHVVGAVFLVGLLLAVALLSVAKIFRQSEARSDKIYIPADPLLQSVRENSEREKASTVPPDATPGNTAMSPSDEPKLSRFEIAERERLLWSPPPPPNLTALLNGGPSVCGHTWHFDDPNERIEGFVLKWSIIFRREQCAGAQTLRPTEARPWAMVVVRSLRMQQSDMDQLPPSKRGDGKLEHEVSKDTCSGFFVVCGNRLVFDESSDPLGKFVGGDFVVSFTKYVEPFSLEYLNLDNKPRLGPGDCHVIWTMKWVHETSLAACFPSVGGTGTVPVTEHSTSLFNKIGKYLESNGEMTWRSETEVSSDPDDLAAARR